MTDARAAALHERLLDIAGPDPSPAERALMARLIENFLRKVPAMLDDLETLLAGDDPAATRTAAHALRGSASNIGADGLALLAGALEDEIRAGHPPAPAAITALRTEIDAVRPLLTAAADRLTG
ncbi:HPt (histidine-containing phosphotransfer) domain-containing protein [Catenuloplanes nepalensis]|uniref:HPt (Histidine-containing phosphotransfer) domain-containing protein n=1 Tax=Catenuloplanes nepalensis TaxID=587533 RepID=A0ABT9MVT9_9ACTN|nr:Hpt domain-containing protein [Catenuloplanes nepalensis]MDP9795348.1 HPt (histidine-containing phosphotransfer) domain-containing protein [Catenuloplanes nepalensis]